MPKKKSDFIVEDTSIRVSSYTTEDIIAEQVYDEKEDIIEFCIYEIKTGKIKYHRQIEESKEIVYKPIVDEEVRKKAILLPSKAEEYGTEEELDKEIKEFITTWLDVPEDFLQFALWNIKRSWVYERFHTINYLRALGDTGQGKSRFLDVLGYLHYKPLATSGATTSAPVFRIIDKWKGTLIIDEADFQKSDESQDIIKIINQGYEKGRHIMRCDKEKDNKVNFFDPFCPKILATRKTFADKAVESRCITQVMTGTSRKDIKWNLNNEFWNKALELRNKLLMWRLKNFYKIDPDKVVDFDMDDIEPRVQQIVGSFISLFTNDEKKMKLFKEFIKNYQTELIEERQNSWDGAVIGGIHNLVSRGVTEITAQDIIDEKQITNKKGNLINPRALSSSLKSLGFGKSISTRSEGKTKRILPLNEDHLTNLFKRYGYDVTVVTVNMGTAILPFIGKKGGKGGNHNNRNNRNTETGNLEAIETEEIENITPTSCGTSTEELLKTIRNLCEELKEKVIAVYLIQDKLKDMKPEELESQIEVLKHKGEIYEPKPGYIGLLE